MVPGPATAEEEEPPPRDARQREVEKQPVPGGARLLRRRRRAPHAVSRLLQANLHFICRDGRVQVPYHIDGGEN